MSYTACLQNGDFVVANVPDGEYMDECEACCRSPKTRPCGDDMNPYSPFVPCSSLKGCKCGNFSNNYDDSSDDDNQPYFGDAKNSDNSSFYRTKKFKILFIIVIILMVLALLYLAQRNY